MENPIKSIYQWQVDAGNASREYDDFLESSFQIEEALEGHDLYELNLFLHGPEYTNKVSAKELSRSIVENCYTKQPISEVDRLDKACDAIVFAIGSIAKLGLNAQQIQQALIIVNNANKAKLGCPRDEHGKLLKPLDFDEKYAPEPKLQALLDSRNK